MKILFMGTPAFAVPSLGALLESRHTVVGVVTQPDRAVKHGKTEKGDVARVAEAAGLKIFQPLKIRDEIDELKSFGADLAVTAAYGQLLTQKVLDVFPRGVLNVHASLLPKYRGASPIQSAVMNGETETGVTIMRTELGLDTGDILSAVKTEIGAEETSGELTSRLAVLGARLLVKTIDELDGILPRKQDDALATHCRTIKKEQHYIDFSKSAVEIVNLIRALCPIPCAKVAINGEVYKIYKAEAESEKCGVTGEIVCGKEEMRIACGVGSISVKTIQAPSKRAMPVADFLRGRSFAHGVVCEQIR